MSEENKPKANVVKTFQVDGAQLRLTDKAAIVVYTTNPDGTYRFSHSLMPRMVKLHAEFGCPVFQSIVQSPEWTAVNESKAKNRELAYLDKRVAKELEKAQAYQQAAIDKIRAMGLDPATILKNIKTA